MRNYRTVEITDTKESNVEGIQVNFNCLSFTTVNVE